MNSLIQSHTETATSRLTGNAITVCLGTAFLKSMANFTAILESQQVISNHNDTLMFIHGAQHPFVVLSFGHLILLMIYNWFKLYTGAVASYKFPKEARCLRVCGILSFNFTVSTGIRFLTRFLFCSSVTLTVCCHERRYFTLQVMASRLLKSGLTGLWGRGHTANDNDNSFKMNGCGAHTVTSVLHE